ncbi:MULTISPECIES: sensor histidine kinase [unclassified Campylobacter]|uniref:fla regulon two-component system sensor histidine kinase FlgS n=1 Tax=unclassified Campylobacter TaxID=2593542 RepID=UPI0012380933|nr:MULTISPECIES: ATP-binding protein [unclassified Campylobacter]KAA6226041.1 GHKL domain-containing protein [Campylobacter sp. LR196d]KAA6226634.1 GHKL domain-containing protein [Campylobacter sp. LR286c]KAA6227564.1 GHKL domain-containing protein [Campylobacter sp. LR185c]KAA6230004.1 GHKL domain-containing protein [Campylobacter sp. LR291e]KAA6230847.1 GHKL domain-containing protein [Campylobacter sp. LR264d]
MNEHILKSLDSREKETLQKGLESLIEQTYVIENEYKILNENYNSLRAMVSEIIEVLPTALWILSPEKEIILQNHEAIKNAELLDKISLDKSHFELEFKGKFYIVKIILQSDKTIISATDISDEKRNERLVSMGSVAAHLAHEIRNPIGSISLLASTLFSRSELKNKHIVLEIQKAIARVERIVKSTLLFTKGVHINANEFNLIELKEECEQAINSYNFSENIEFKMDFLDINIKADKALLSLVLQNLIYNGIDAIEEADNENGKMRIESFIKDKILYIRVFDNGINIKDENLVFEAFKTTKLKGNGLGLCLSKEIINAHGGELSFEKEPKNFYFTLPL